MVPSVVAIVLMLSAHPAAAVDATGNWLLSYVLFGQAIVAELQQSGMTLNVLHAEYPFAGTINSASGAFDTYGAVGPGCPPGNRFMGTVAPDGNTLTGTMSIIYAGFPECLRYEFDIDGVRVPPGCGDGDLDGDEECDDGNQTSGDGCNGACRIESCGNGRRDQSEECDDGDLDGGDGCAADCFVEPCFECAGSSPSSCGPAAFCGLCGPRPRSTCRQLASGGKSTLMLQDGSTPQQSSFAWTWLHGEAVTLADLGDPTTDTGYAVCLYRGAGSTPDWILAEYAFAGPGWSANADGFAYSDGSASNGVNRMRVRAGAAGKSSVRAKGKGINVNAPALPLASPVLLRVQVHAAEPFGTISTCFEATYTPANVLRNDDTRLRAKIP